MSAQRSDRQASGSGVIATFATDFPWFHRWMGLVGNGLFLVGSVFFLIERLTLLGTWIFVGASFGMFVDSVGEKVVRREQERARKGSQGRQALERHEHAELS